MLIGLEERAAPPASYFSARERLLQPPLSGQRLTLRGVRKAGWDLAGNPNELSIYGMKPLAWYAIGIRILGRTAVELTRDAHAEFIGRSLATTISAAAVQIRDVIDPFAGSGNTLFHIAKAVGAKVAIGLDANREIAGLTRRNFSRLKLTMRLWGIDTAIAAENWTAAVDLMQDKPTLIFISPPWGEAFSTAGLDLTKTRPPVLEILEKLSRGVRRAPVFVAIHTYPKMIETSVDEIKRRYETFPTLTSSDPYVAGSVNYLLLRLPGPG
jgi:hypothetical protein